MTMMVEGRGVMVVVVVVKRIKEERRKTVATREERDGKRKMCLFSFHLFTYNKEWKVYISNV